MSKLVDPELIERFQARAVNAGPEICAGFDGHAIASAVNDEVRHGKPGTVRSANAVFVHRADLRLRELADLARSRARQQQQDQARYAELWVTLLESAATKQLSPSALVVALRFWRDHGYPKLNPLIADQLSALGERWPSQGLPDAPPREMTKSRRTHAPKEGRRARAVSQPAR